MNCGAIERELQRMQAASPEDHLPLEFVLEALHFEEYPSPPFFRSPKVPMLDFHNDVMEHEREPRRMRRYILTRRD